MRIARPPEGFAIDISATVATLVASEIEAFPTFERHWGDILERMRFTAHREGKPEPRLGNGYRLIAISGIQSEARPRVVVGYLVLGDQLRIRLLRISR